MNPVRQIILASKSPRRKGLLEKIGLKFVIDPSGYEEVIKEKLSPSKLAKRLSFAKAKAVVPRYANALIISADTLVIIGSRILGKPKTQEKAREMLGILNGKIHYVITGFTVYDTQNNKFVTKSVRSSVYFNKVSKKDIDNYVTAKKPFDKAGAYGIQELPKIFIKKIVGDYTNVVGLPIDSLMKELKKFGVK